jgi:hypothetical protein
VDHGPSTNGHTPHAATDGPLPGDAWEELLSAYVDGEVSEAERILVDHWLARDPAARTMLAELRALSVALHELPRSAPPAELQPATLQLAQQRPLPTKLVTAPRRMRRREWFAGLSALVATLAFIVVWRPGFSPEGSVSTGAILSEGMLVGTSDWKEGVRGPADNLTDLLAATDGVGVAFDADEAMVRATGRTSMMKSEAVFDERDVTARSHMGRDRFGLADQPVADQDVAASGLVSAESRGVNAREDNVTLKAMASMGEPASAALVPLVEALPTMTYLSQNTSAVSNVDLFVVDAEIAADRFQVLLLDNGVAIPADAPEAEQLARAQDRKEDHNPEYAEAKAKVADHQPKLYAMYVEADGVAITRTLQQLIEQRQLLAVKLQAPIDVGYGIIATSEPQPAVRAEGNGNEPLNSNYHRGVNDVQKVTAAYMTQRFMLRGWGDIDEGISAIDMVENQPATPLGLIPQLAQGSQPTPSAPILSNGISAESDAFGTAMLAERMPKRGVNLESAAEFSNLGDPIGYGFQRRLDLSSERLNWFLEAAETQGLASKEASQNSPATADELRQYYYKPPGTSVANGKSDKGSQMSGVNRQRQSKNGEPLPDGTIVNFNDAPPNAVRVIFQFQPAPVPATP